MNKNRIDKITDGMKKSCNVRKPENMFGIACPAAINVSDRLQTLTYFFPPQTSYYRFFDEHLWIIAEMIPQDDNQKGIIAFCLYKKEEDTLVSGSTQLKEVCVITSSSEQQEPARARMNYEGDLGNLTGELELITSFSLQVDSLLNP